MTTSEAGSQREPRAANRRPILDLLRAQGPMTQADLARASKLSPATISSIARELRDEGSLEDGDATGSARRHRRRDLASEPRRLVGWVAVAIRAACSRVRP